jgi:hypothetical protein
MPLFPSPLSTSHDSLLYVAAVPLPLYAMTPTDQQILYAQSPICSWRVVTVRICGSTCLSPINLFPEQPAFANERRAQDRSEHLKRRTPHYHLWITNTSGLEDDRVSSTTGLLYFPRYCDRALVATTSAGCEFCAYQFEQFTCFSIQRWR